MDKIYEEMKEKVNATLKETLDSSNFLLELLVFYDHCCLQGDIRSQIVMEVSSAHKMLFNGSYSSSYNYKQNKFYNHRLLSVIDLITRYNSELLTEGYGKPIEMSKIPYRVQKLQDNIDLLLDYLDIVIAKDALYSKRYIGKIIDINTLVLSNVSTKYNIQGSAIRKNPYLREIDKRVIQKIGQPLRKSIARLVYNDLLCKLTTLKPIDTIAIGYTVHDFISVWSIILWLALSYTEYQTIVGVRKCWESIDLQSQITATGIKEFYDILTQYLLLQNKKIGNIAIPTLSVSYIKEAVNNYFGVSLEKIQLILDDLTYKLENSQFEYKLLDYPVIYIHDSIYISPWMVLHEIDPEILLKRKSKAQYSNIYDELHTVDIEPRLCNKIRTILQVNDNFLVKVIPDTLNDESSKEQSQIDIFIYDKKTRDILIIEVKDHIAKLDQINPQNQVKFEMNVFRKDIVGQLERQRKLLMLQRNLDLFLCNISKDEIGDIYMAYCEQHYLGTPNFIERLQNKSIAFIPYAVLTNNCRFDSVEEMYNYFFNVKYIDDKLYTYFDYEINVGSYKVSIPAFN